MKKIIFIYKGKVKDLSKSIKLNEIDFLINKRNELLNKKCDSSNDFEAVQEELNEVEFNIASLAKHGVIIKNKDGVTIKYEGNNN